ncbi:MAG: hypothetical protein QM728_14315 [Gordonia sp. (in: high G+C Gram-positive bacteria)]|uniref:hypothetical protein n=1 Tax=Gordonia sp. (in: high G+C Gram-positive bacteria) TaxID=84139 RepID=UPI0039E21C4A
MRTTFTGRVALGLMGSAAAAAIIAPVASGATEAGPAAAVKAHTVKAAPVAPVLPSMPGKQLVTVPVAPVGMNGPAITNFVTVAVDKKALADAGVTPAALGRTQVAKRGYVNVGDAANQGALQGAGQGAAVGALGGAIAGGVISGLGVLIGGLFLPPVWIPAIIAAIGGALFGALAGAIIGAIGGGINGYIQGENQAKRHNDAVRRNGGRPVSAPVTVNASTPVNPVDQFVQNATKQAQAFIPAPRQAVAPAPVQVPQIAIPTPKQVNQTINTFHRNVAKQFGLPIPAKQK